jgi:hypothetical protein
MILRRRRCDAEVATNCRNQNAPRVSLAVAKVYVELVCRIGSVGATSLAGYAKIESFE